MAITNSISQMFPAPGIPFYQNKGASAFQSLANAITDGAHTVVLTFPVETTVSRGKWRIKVSTQVNTPSVILQAYFSDGTNKVDILLPLSAFSPTATTATSGIDIMGEFNIDISATTFSVVITLAGSSETAVLDFEVFSIQ